jgi:hypothetical protein
VPQKLKIYAKDILRKRVAGNYDLLEKNLRSDNIVQNALVFMSDYMSKLTLPSSPQIIIGNIHGFESVNKTASETIGSLLVTVKFKIIAGTTISLDIPLVVYYGKFVVPSVCTYKSKKYVMSQSFIDKLLSNTETITPKNKGLYNNDLSVQHDPTVNDNIFQVPKDNMEYQEYGFNY